MTWRLFKSSSRVAMIAAAGLVTGSVAVQAADLGGDCCADLEERVAELEATTVRKGNTRVSLTLTGAVTQNIIWHNSDSPLANRPDEITITGANGNDNDAYFILKGSAAVNADLSIGYHMDINVDSQSGLSVDDLYLYFQSTSLGKVSLGRIDPAIDGIHATSLAKITNVMNDEAGEIYFLGSHTDGSGYYSLNNFDGGGARNGRIRYDSPDIAGFKLSTSWSHGNDTDEDEDSWSVALRYAGEFGAFRVAGGVGYQERENEGAGFVDPTMGDLASLADHDSEELGGSVSVMHVPTGIFVNAAYGQEEGAVSVGGGTNDAVLDEQGLTVVVGVERKWNSLGNTTIFGFWQNFDGSYEVELSAGDGELMEVVEWDVDNFGFGIVQQVDAAATTLSLEYRNYECAPVAASILEGVSCESDADVIQSGIAVKF